MNMINASDTTIRVPADLLTDDAWQGKGARPTHVDCPPGAVLPIQDAYALRKRTVAPQLNGRAVPTKSVVEQRCPQLKPHGTDAETLYATKCVEDLDHVQRAFAELERVGKASAGTAEGALVNAMIEKGIREGIAATLGNRQQEPLATPVFVAVPTTTD